MSLNSNMEHLYNWHKSHAITSFEQEDATCNYGGVCYPQDMPLYAHISGRWYCNENIERSLITICAGENGFLYRIGLPVRCASQTERSNLQAFIERYNQSSCLSLLFIEDNRLYYTVGIRSDYAETYATSLTVMPDLTPRFNNSFDRYVLRDGDTSKIRHLQNARVLIDQENDHHANIFEHMDGAIHYRLARLIPFALNAMHKGSGFYITEEELELLALGKNRTISLSDINSEWEDWTFNEYTYYSDIHIHPKMIDLSPAAYDIPQFTHWFNCIREHPYSGIRVKKKSAVLCHEMNAIALQYTAIMDGFLRERLHVLNDLSVAAGTPTEILEIPDVFLMMRINQKCLMICPEKDARLAEIPFYFEVKENGIIFRAHFPVLLHHAKENISQFFQMLSPTLCVGALKAEYITPEPPPYVRTEFRPCFEVGVPLTDDAQIDMNALMEQVMSYCKEVLLSVADEYIGVLCGENPVTLANACIAKLPKWTGAFPLVSADSL